MPLFTSGSTTTYATDRQGRHRGQHDRGTPPGSSTATRTTRAGRSRTRAKGRASYTSAPFYGYTQGPGYYGKTFFIWPPDPRRPLTTGQRLDAPIKQFLTDFGYTSTDFSGGTTGPPLYGIYSVTSTPGSQNWPWPNDGGTTLSTYLTAKVYMPGRKPQAHHLGLAIPADHAALLLELRGRQPGNDPLRLAAAILRHQRQHQAVQHVRRAR